MTFDAPQPTYRRAEGFAIVALVLGLVAVAGFPLIGWGAGNGLRHHRPPAHGVLRT